MNGILRNVMLFLNVGEKVEIEKRWLWVKFILHAFITYILLAKQKEQKIWNEKLDDKPVNKLQTSSKIWSISLSLPYKTLKFERMKLTDFHQGYYLICGADCDGVSRDGPIRIDKLLKDILRLEQIEIIVMNTQYVSRGRIGMNLI